MPEELKPKLRKVYGKLCSSTAEATQVLTAIPNRGKIITVGDIVSYNIISAGINPDIIVYDGKEARQSVKSWMKNFLDAYIAESKTVENPAGHITGELWQAAFEALRAEGKRKIFVRGEEDLAVIPFIILGSVGDCIMYGMPAKYGGGIDLIVVDNEVKDEFKKILKQLKEDKESEKKRIKRLKEEKIKEMFGK